MFEGINHEGMNQEQWYQLNLEGGLWPWKEQKTMGHTIFSFLPSIQVISQPHKIHFHHYPLNQLGYGGAPFLLYFVIVASHMQIHKACLRSTRTYTSQRRLLKEQRGRAF
jgi:hypothetical protein